MLGETGDTTSRDISVPAGVTDPQLTHQQESKPDYFETNSEIIDRLAAEPLTEEHGFMLSLALDTLIDPDRQEAEQYRLPENALPESALEGFLRTQGFGPIIDGFITTTDVPQQRHWRLNQIYSMYYDQEAKTQFEDSQSKPSS